MRSSCFPKSRSVQIHEYDTGAFEFSIPYTTHPQRFAFRDTVLSSSLLGMETEKNQRLLQPRPVATRISDSAPPKEEREYTGKLMRELENHAKIFGC